MWWRSRRIAASSALFAGNLLALMGLTGLAGVIASGSRATALGPVWPTAAAFAARIVVFGWIAIDQSPLSIAVFALVFGATFLVTAPLTVVFVRESFGTKNLGALAGLITMVHQIFGGLGAYAGAAIFDATGGYDAAFVVDAGLGRGGARAHADAAAAQRCSGCSLRLDAGLADDALVFLAFGLHERGELLGRQRRHVGAGIEQLLPRLRDRRGSC